MKLPGAAPVYTSIVILFPFSSYLTLIASWCSRLDFNGCDMMMLQHHTATNNTAHLHSLFFFPLHMYNIPSPRTVQIFHKYSPPESDVAIPHSAVSDWLASKHWSCVLQGLFA